MTVASSASGSISRAAAARAARSSRRRSQPSSRIASASRPSNAAQADHRVVALATDRPVVAAAGERALQPGRVELDRDLGGLGGALEAALLGAGQDAVAGRDELVEEGRQVARPCRSRSAASAGPAGRSPGSSPPRDRCRRPRAGRRSRPAARRAARGRARTAGRGRRRPCRARTTVAPRSAGRRCRRSRGGGCGSRGRARSGPRRTGRPDRAPRSPARWARSAASSARTCSRLPSPSRSSSSWRPRAVPRTGLSRTSRTKRASTRS